MGAFLSLSLFLSRSLFPLPLPLLFSPSPSFRDCHIRLKTHRICLFLVAATQIQSRCRHKSRLLEWSESANVSAEVQKFVLSLADFFTNISMHQELHANRTQPGSWREWIAVEIEQRIPKKVADELKHIRTHRWCRWIPSVIFFHWKTYHFLSHSGRSVLEGVDRS